MGRAALEEIFFPLAVGKRPFVDENKQTNKPKVRILGQLNVLFEIMCRSGPTQSYVSVNVSFKVVCPPFIFSLAASCGSLLLEGRQLLYERIA